MDTVRIFVHILVLEYCKIVDKLPLRQKLIPWLESVLAVAMNIVIHVTFGLGTLVQRRYMISPLRVHRCEFFYALSENSLNVHLYWHLLGNTLWTRNTFIKDTCSWEFTDHRWFLLTNGQYCGKCLHDVMDDGLRWWWKLIILFRKSLVIFWRSGELHNLKPNSYTPRDLLLVNAKMRHWTAPSLIQPGLYSLSRRTSYHKISRSLEAAKFGFKLVQSLWNLTGISTALLQISERYDHYIIQSCGFETSRDLAVRRLTA